MKRGRVFKWGGVVSGGVLVAFGIAVIVLALLGRNTLNNELEQQRIIGTPDMSPSGITAGIEAAGLKDVDIPDCDVAGKPIDNGPRARCFAQYMFIHALEGTGGFVYSEMGQYAAKPGAPADQLAPGGGTNNPEFAQIDPVTKQPASNGARNVWVTETALSTGLNVTFMASLLVLFTLLVGVALLLAGVGFIVIGLGLLPPRPAAEGAENSPA